MAPLVAHTCRAERHGPGRIEQIALTLERWRSLPRDFGRNYVWSTSGRIARSVRGRCLRHGDEVVVGDPSIRRRSCRAASPPSLSIRLARSDLDRTKGDSPKVRPIQAISRRTNGRQGTYIFEQLPAPRTAGQIKFETPNKFDVYCTILDAQYLRARARALSHVCVRTENARELAAYC